METNLKNNETLLRSYNFIIEDLHGELKSLVKTTDHDNRAKCLKYIFDGLYEWKKAENNKEISLEEFKEMIDKICNF